MPQRIARVAAGHPPRPHDLAHRPRQTRSRRGLMVVLAGFAMVTSGIFRPVAARETSTSPRPLAGWSTEQRSIFERRVPSARKAGVAAQRDVRPMAVHVARPRPRVTRMDLAAPVREPFAGAAASLRRAASAAAVTPRIAAPPDIVASQTLAGLAQAESGGFLPPDPWVAVNSAYVVQSVNSMIRVTDRLGIEISTIPVWSLFALPIDQNPTDPRILWDATHGRWVAMASSFRIDDSLDFLNLAVSDSADPTAGWSIHAVSYDHAFPDYPSIASSNDKIVITDDIFDPSLNFVGAEINTFTWSSILGGASVLHNACVAPVYVHPRASQILSSSTDVHLIMENLGDPTMPGGEQIYFRVKGVGNCDVPDIIDGTNLSWFAPFTPPPDPRQTGDTIAGAIDERPTDAIWKDGSLWWTSTFPVSYDVNLTFNDAVVLWNLTTTAGAPTAGTPLVVSAGDGIDDYMGGIGLTRDGNLIAVYSESSPSALISMRALRVPPGGSTDTGHQLDLSLATYASERWGDYAGVAMDPVGTGAVWATHEVAAADGTWRTTIARLVVDGDSPTTPGAVTAALAVPTALGSSPAVRLRWPLATDTASGAVRYQIAQQVDGLGFGAISNLSGSSTTRSLTVGHPYQFEVRAVDAVGTTGSWRLSPILRTFLYQSTSSTTVVGRWRRSLSASYSGSSTRYASTAGASATFTATAARSIAIVTTRAATRGSFKVYVDRVYKGTISTYSPLTRFRQLVYQVSWPRAGIHRIKIVVSGTARHARVDLDAFVVLR